MYSHFYIYKSASPMYDICMKIHFICVSQAHVMLICNCLYCLLWKDSLLYNIYYMQPYLPFSSCTIYICAYNN